MAPIVVVPEPQGLQNYLGDTVTDGNTPFIAAKIPVPRGKFWLFESLMLTYSGAYVPGSVDLDYEDRLNDPSSRIVMARHWVEDNLFVPLINGISSETHTGRTLAGRAPVLVEGGKSLLIVMAGFTTAASAGGRLVQIRGRYWEGQSWAEIYQYLVGLNP